MDGSQRLFERFGKLFPAGTVVFKELETGKEMFVIQTGRVRITKKIENMEKTLAILGPGEIFGEMAIINQKPRSATATVIEQAKLLVIDPGTFEAMIRGSPEIVFRLIKTLADRLQHADKQIENLMRNR